MQMMIHTHKKKSRPRADFLNGHEIFRLTYRSTASAAFFFCWLASTVSCIDPFAFFQSSLSL
jgi:hypothetical protein